MNNESLPKISIVVPSFNQGQFLEDAILSILNQSYPNKELLILDGRSTDQSLEIIKKYEREIYYWRSHPDGGQTSAINEGFKKSNGEIIGWLNSDDMLSPECLFSIANTFSSDINIGLVCGQLKIIDRDGKTIDTKSNEKVDFEGLLNGCSNVHQPGSFYRKSYVEKIGYLDESYSYSMDYDLWLKLASTSKIVVLNDVLAFFREHPDSKTISNPHKFIPEKIKIRKYHKGKFFCYKNWEIIRNKISFYKGFLKGSRIHKDN